MTLAPGLLQRLSRSSLRTRVASPSSGIGERRSKQKGAGLEFTDHRPYQPGDDLRHLDPHLHARLGEHFIRQYAVYQQLSITILVDGTQSMNYGDPQKFAFARDLAAAIGFVGLAGGDRVLVGMYGRDRVRWAPPLQGVRRAQILFDWLNTQRCGGNAPIGMALREAASRLVPGGMLVLISDFWSDDLDADFNRLGATGQELIAVHVVAPEERAPASLGGGEVRVVDAESGYEVELVLDRATLDGYERAFSEWTGRLSSTVARRRGRYLQVGSDDDIQRTLLQDWRREGFIAL